MKSLRIVYWIFVILALAVFPDVARASFTTAEICANKIDEDSNGSDLSCAGDDADVDGFDAAHDCNDNDFQIVPGQYYPCDAGSGANTGTRICNPNGTYGTCVANATTPLCEKTGGGNCYYINPTTGSDTPGTGVGQGDGSYAHPWASLKCVAKFFTGAPACNTTPPPGSRIYMMGSANYTTNYDPDGAGSILNVVYYADSNFAANSSNPTIIKRYPGSTLTITCPTNSNVHTPCMQFEAAHYWGTVDLDITGGYGNAVYANPSNGFQYLRMNVHDIRGLRNNNLSAFSSNQSINTVSKWNKLIDIADANETSAYLNVTGIVIFNDNTGGGHEVAYNRIGYTNLPNYAGNIKGSGIKFKHGAGCPTSDVQCQDGGNKLNKVHHNIIWNVQDACFISNTSGIRAYDNLCVNSQSYCFRQEEDSPNWLQNGKYVFNTCVNGRLINITGETYPNPPYGPYYVQDNVTVYDRVFAGDEGGVQIDQYGNDTQFGYLYTDGKLFIDRNSYFNTAAAGYKWGLFAAVSGNGGHGPAGDAGAYYTSLSSWQAIGFDKEGVVEDPLLDSSFRATAPGSSNKGWRRISTVPVLVDSFDTGDVSSSWGGAYTKDVTHYTPNTAETPFVSSPTHSGSKAAHYYTLSGTNEHSPITIPLGEERMKELFEGSYPDQLYFEWFDYFDSAYCWPSSSQKMFRIGFDNSNFPASKKEYNLVVQTNNGDVNVQGFCGAWGDSSLCNVDFAIHSSEAHPLGQYVKWGYDIKLNTPGASDGYIKVYRNNQLYLSQTSVNLRGNDSKGFSYLWLGGNYSNLTGGNLSCSGHRYLDDVKIYTTPPPPAATPLEQCGDGIDNDNSGVFGSCPAGEVNAANGIGCDKLCPGEDKDGDGFLASEDCDDNDIKVFPGEPKLCTVTTANDGWKVCKPNGQWSGCTKTSVTPWCKKAAGGKCYYVDPVGGNNASNGLTPATAKLNYLQFVTYFQTGDRPAGWIQLVPGDSLVFMNGTLSSQFSYNGANRMFNLENVDGTADAPIGLYAYPGASFKIDNTGTFSSVNKGAILNFNGSDNIIVSGLELKNGYGQAIKVASSTGFKAYKNLIHDIDGDDVTNHAGIYTTQVGNEDIFLNFMWDNYDRSGGVTNLSKHILMSEGYGKIRRNSIWNTVKASGGTGITISKARPTMPATERIEVSDNSLWNMPYFAIANGQKQVLIRNNRVDLADYGFDVQGHGVPNYTDDVMISYNTVRRSRCLNFNPNITYNPSTGSADNSGSVKMNNFHHNICDDVTTSYGSTDGIITVSPTGSDTLYSDTNADFSPFFNCYYNPNTAIQFSYFAGSPGTTGGNYTLSTWKSTVGKDKNSFEGDWQPDIYGRATAPNCIDFGWMPLWKFSAAVPAFPGAVGFGRYSVHGSGRNSGTPSTTVFKVTNLNTSGAGSLRACVEGSGPRVCVFETSGKIVDTASYRVQNPYLYIAGQTAPSPGITVQGVYLSIEASDVLVRHIAFRVGDSVSGPDPEQRDAVKIVAFGTSQTKNVYVDHVSATWGLDENLSTYQDSGAKVSEVTIANCLISEGLYDSIHPEGPHGFGTLIGIGSQNITFTNNLLSHSKDRCGPRINQGNTIEVLNNLIYDWGSHYSNAMNISDSSSSGIPHYILAAGNYFKRGPSGNPTAPISTSATASNTAVGTLLNIVGNIGPARQINSGDDWLVAYQNLTTAHQYYTSPFEASGAPIWGPNQTYDLVPKNVGSRPIDRSSVDTRIINQAINGTGGLINCVVNDASPRCAANAGGYPTVAVNTRSLTVPTNKDDIMPSGYTRLEEWLESFIPQVENRPNPALGNVPYRVANVKGRVFKP